MNEEEIENLKQELRKNVKTYTPKIRTGEQLERENYLLCFRSKSQLASMLIDAEEKIDKAIAYTEQLEHSDWICFGRTILLEILKGDKE